ncbi:MAG: VTT domain-containing protein [Methanobacteriaceae archaeon]|nr:VTT domain-containing protein [Methanobacteriaceae archaeon]
MIEEIILGVETFFLNYGALGVFLASIIEEIIAPIPSTLVIMGSSFLILKGYPLDWASIGMLLINVVLPASAGVTLGSLFVYTIGYFLGSPFIKRWGKYMGVSWEDIEKAEGRFSSGHSDNLILFTLRAVPVVPSVAISIFCGFIRYRLRDYLIFTLLGSLVRGFILGLLGWQFGMLYLEISQQISFLEEVVLALLVVALAVYLYRRKQKKPKQK